MAFLRCSLALLLLALLPSCLTTALWASDPGPDVTSYSTRGSSSGSDIAQKLALTPFTLLLDFVTLPIQALFHDDSDNSAGHSNRLQRRLEEDPSKFCGEESAIRRRR